MTKPPLSNANEQYPIWTSSENGDDGSRFYLVHVQIIPGVTLTRRLLYSEIKHMRNPGYVAGHFIESLIPLVNFELAKRGFNV